MKKLHELEDILRPNFVSYVCVICPFAANGHISTKSAKVEASYVLGHPKRRKFKFD